MWKVKNASSNQSGESAENSLESVGIVCNRNVVPKDEETPGKVSGIRLGSGAVSARGMETEQMVEIVELIDHTLLNQANQEVLDRVAGKVLKLCRTFPVNGFAV